MFRYLAPNEYDVTLQHVANYEGEIGPAGRVAISILLGLHGLRCGEVCGLIVGDFDPGRGATHVATLKKGRPRSVDVERRLAIWLGRLCAGQPRSAPILRTCRGRPLHTSQLQRAWRKLSHRWLGRPVRFHCLRHSTAQRLYESTKDLLLVQAFLGHRSLAATLVYASSVGLAKDFMPKLPDPAKFQPLLFEAG